MRVDNNTLNYLSRGVEHTHGPRLSTARADEGFGRLFDTASRARSQASPGAPAESSAPREAQRPAEPDRAKQHESSDDPVGAVAPGEADAPDRDVDQPGAEAPVAGPSDKPSGDDRPDEKHTSDEQPSDGTDTRQAEVVIVDPPKPVVTVEAGGGVAPSSDAQTDPNRSGAATTAGSTSGKATGEADRAAKVLQQIRQPQQASSAGLDQGQSGKPTPATAPSVEPVAAQPDAALAAQGRDEAKPARPAPPPGAPQASESQPVPPPPAAHADTPSDGDAGGGQRRSASDGAAGYLSRATEQANKAASAEDVDAARAPRPVAGLDADPAPRGATPTPSVPAASPSGPLPAATAAATIEAPPASAASAGTDLPEADASRLTDRVVKSLHTLGATRGGTVTLRLTPPEMGSLRIQITMSGGAVHASFEASSAAVGRVLQDGAGTLRQALERQGMTVERIDVHVQHAPASGQAGAQHQQQSGDAPGDGRSRGAMSEQGRQPSQQQGQDGDDPRRRDFRRELLDLVA